MKLQNIAVAQLVNNPANPRTSLSEVKDLAASIRTHGIIEPLIVRKGADGFVILAGHRRAAAAAEAELETVPCIVRPDLAAEGDAVLALVENTQRVDLTPLETAQAIKAALGNMKQKELAAQLGRSEAYVSKFKTIIRAFERLEGQGLPTDYLGDFTSYEDLYNEARKVLGLDKAKEQQELQEVPPAQKPANDEDPPLSDVDALRSLIAGHAEIAKVKPGQIHCEMATDGTGNVLVQIEFKKLKDAEKFFTAYVSNAKGA